MQLIHYSHAVVELNKSEVYEEEKKWLAKPDGLWFSVKGKCDWKWWCEGENYRTENLAVAHEIKLKSDAKILYLNNEEELFAFTRQYRKPSRIFDNETDTYEIKWSEIKKLYQGIIIPNYLWDCRLALESSWYYGWDCASGCIWDLSCIESFKVIQEVIECQT